MSVNFDITQRLDEAWTVDDMYASVITSTGQMIDLNIQNLLDYEVMWYGQSMTGIIVSRTVTTIIQLSILP